MNEMITDELLKKLLSTLLDNPKIVHLGASPVTATEAALEAESRGLVHTISSRSSAWTIALTQKGKEFVAAGKKGGNDAT
jgi:hypothetical protein